MPKPAEPARAPRILRLRDVCAATGLSRSSLYQAEKAGRFPARIALGARAVGWHECDVAAWIASRVQRMQPEPVHATTAARAKRQRAREAAPA